MPSLLDLLLPATDAGVMVQVGVVALAGSAAAMLLRRQRDVLLVVVGVTLVALGLMAVRALH